mmetsp:Transcript_9648/g.35348  ORF Transcript_9648/g.35348 Transcript_9648/m.35348 type:complete len:539 (-) Transcript_9648:132-1748(-)
MGGSMRALLTEDEESLGAASILTQMVSLVIALIIGVYLRYKGWQTLHSAGAALLLGVIVGLVTRLVNRVEAFREWIDFSDNFFFLFLIPPIIFESGYNMQPTPFFANFGAICCFAFLGTAISAFVTGSMVYGLGAIGACYKLQPLNAFIFGSLISATDPVTVLAIFSEMGADKNLYSLVFGESVLNDAVAIVMYQTMLSFYSRPIDMHGIAYAISYFLMIFVGSWAIGTVTALASAALLKFTNLGKSEEHAAPCIVVLFPYIAYMAAEALRLSGIVSILFCGIVMAHYTKKNLSQKVNDSTTAVFQILAHLAETFIFIYMGVATFLEEQAWQHVSLTMFSILAVLIARLFNVYPLSFLVNLFRRREKRIPKTHQFVLWFSGLRGAIAFALALKSTQDLVEEEGRAILTSTLFIVLFTVLAIGGSTGAMVEKLQLRGYEQPKEEDFDEERLEMTPMDAAEETPEGGSLRGRLQELSRNSTFERLDKNYLRPFFTSEAVEPDPSHDDGPGNGEQASSAGMDPQPLFAQDGPAERTSSRVV